MDAGGVPDANDAPAKILTDFSRSRTVNVTSPLQKCVRRIRYTNWLMQTCPTAWLKTRATPNGDREVYPDAANTANTPVIKMATQVIAPVQGQVMGILRVGASISVRGRQLDLVNAA